MQSENPMSFFSENVDDWGAAEWFDRAAKAIRSQDKANVKGDDVAFETYRMIAASSLAKLVREHEDTVRAALSTDAEPVMYVSEQQLGFIGQYLPTRKEAEGNFQLALYRAPPAPAVAVKAIAPVDVYKALSSFVENDTFDKDHVSAISRTVAAALSAQVQDVAEGWWVDELRSFWGDSSYQPTLETRRAVLVALNALGVTASPASKHGDAE